MNSLSIVSLRPVMLLSCCFQVVARSMFCGFTPSLSSCSIYLVYRLIGSDVVMTDVILFYLKKNHISVQSYDTINKYPVVF